MHTESGAWRQFDLYLGALVDKDSRIKILLNQLQQRNPALYKHSCRVAQVCFGLVSHLSQMNVITRKKEFVRNLFVFCGLLHDIGMLLIPDIISEKFLEGEARDSYIQNYHAFYGYFILRHLNPDIASLVYLHHRRDNKCEFRPHAGQDNRIALQFYDPLADASVVFPLSVLSVAERRELAFALAVAEYIVTEYFDKNIAITPAVFEKIAKEFPHCQNANEALRRLFSDNLSAPKSCPLTPPLVPKKS